MKIRTHEETIEHPVKGTIVDLETLPMNSWRKNEFAQQHPIIFGTLSGTELKISYIMEHEQIPDLIELMKAELPDLPTPLWAFNTSFERGVIHTHTGLLLEFQELQQFPFEAKRDAVKKLKIPQFDDPYPDDGMACAKGWFEGEIDKAVMHNRACLLKEAEIFRRRILGEGLDDGFQRTIAVTFDEVIHQVNGQEDEEYFGPLVPGAREALEALRNDGWTIIVYTDQEDTPSVQEYLQMYQVPFDYVNENPHAPAGQHPRKLYADLYLEPKAVPFPGTWQGLLGVISRLARIRGLGRVEKPKESPESAVEVNEIKWMIGE